VSGLFVSGLVEKGIGRARGEENTAQKQLLWPRYIFKKFINSFGNQCWITSRYIYV
jgi:hypothetical protein